MAKKKNDYLNFLKGLVTHVSSYSYSKLLDYLHTVEFYSLVPNDDNRCADGEQFRNIFIDEVSPTKASSLPSGPCTVLEMLLGLAYRLEFELSGGIHEQTASDWFWVLIENLGLDWYDDVELERESSFSDVNSILEILLERRYSVNGDGGLFPLVHTIKDQRRIEIWYQMSAWVIENYPI